MPTVEGPLFLLILTVAYMGCNYPEPPRGARTRPILSEMSILSSERFVISCNLEQLNEKPK